MKVLSAIFILFVSLPLSATDSEPFGFLKKIFDQTTSGAFLEEIPTLDEEHRGAKPWYGIRNNVDSKTQRQNLRGIYHVYKIAIDETKSAEDPGGPFFPGIPAIPKVRYIL